jgi:hypothetical protein
MNEAELQNDYVSKMGADLGEIYYSLYKEVVWLHARWQQYRKLFAESDNVATLNQHGSFIFKLVQDGLWEDTLLHISRLTDPVESVGKENLTIQMLPGLVSEQALKADVQRLVDDAVNAAAFAREHRNKRLAHRDLQHAASPSAAPLSGISRQNVESMLDSIRKVMNRLENHFRNGTVAFEYFLVPAGGAEQLLQKLKNVG